VHLLGCLLLYNPRALANWWSLYHDAHCCPGGTNESALHIQCVVFRHGLRARRRCAASFNCLPHPSHLPPKNVSICFGTCSFHSSDTNFKHASNSLVGQSPWCTPMSSRADLHRSLFAWPIAWASALAPALLPRASSWILRRPRHKPNGCFHPLPHLPRYA
jgi:hypothetical protein